MTHGPSALTRELGHRLLWQMLRIRRFEERCGELYTQAKIRGFLHLYIGQEAIATGVIDALDADDAVVATYREHGHALAKGITADAIMAEMFGKQEGCSRGRGGSMHLFSAAHRFYGGHGIVGAGLPMAVGLALADKLLRRRRVSVCFFGEGATFEGEFHESLNLAALWKLPVLFVCENNRYAMGTALDRCAAQPDMHLKAAAYQIPAVQVDGMDALAVRHAALRAAMAIREGEGPRFIECTTYRFRAHSMFDPELYREKREVEAWKARCPILHLTTQLQAEALLDANDLAAMEQAVSREVEAAVAFAEAGTWEPVESLARFVHSEAPSDNIEGAERPGADGAVSPVTVSGGAHGTAPDAPSATVTYREAVRDGLREALRRDDRVFLLGEDVCRYGGTFAVTKGFLEEFGEERIRDTPLSESAFVGAGIGAALGGLRPIVEVMTVNFSLLALDQILNTAATWSHMSGGQFHVPLVIRMATGAGRQLGAQHSLSLEGWYAHIPGLTIAVPATLEDARGMLAAALEDPDPVLLFEHAGLYNVSGTLPADPVPVDLRRAAIRRAGRDVTLITAGAHVHTCLSAAEVLAGLGIEAEVIDLRVLRPLDTATVLASVQRTRRAVVVEDGWTSGGISAEVSARIMEGAFWSLDAPVARVCRAEVPMPYAAHLEQAALPQVDAVVEAVRAQFGAERFQGMEHA